jgi:hypothetical protein
MGDRLIFCKQCDCAISLCEGCHLIVQCLAYDDHHPECPHEFCSIECSKRWTDEFWMLLRPWSDRE